MPLVEPVDTPRLADFGKVHFIAIGGAGMSGVASGFLAQGHVVSGSDQADSEILRELESQGAQVWVGQDATHIGDVDTVVVSTAIRPDNPELVEAHRRGLPVLHRSVALAALMEDKVVVSVAGTHGKTTTTAMCVAGLESVGTDPSYVLGGTIVSSGLGSHMGTDNVFIVEADESDGSFRQYPTNIAVITCIETDHLDTWGTAQAYRDGFAQFASRESIDTLIVNGDDEGAVDVREAVKAAGKKVVTYGRSTSCDLVISDVDLTGPVASAVFAYAGRKVRVRLSVPGVHNLYNGAAALLVGLALGANEGSAAMDDILAGIASFTGTKRRFQLVGEVESVSVVDDYAHHPTEVAATLASAREVAGTGRVLACFQPHLYSRTLTFADEFGAALAKADFAFVTDVYGAREDPVPGMTGELIVDAVSDHGGVVTYVPAYECLPAVVAAVAQPGDLVLTIGAGSITTIGPKILEALSHV
ncbi:MAG: UDP-N-acetylmuramate--L-alanine ligase [Propionibacteriaceae bacterium]|jgi:UDP-N-acetylmuramate--alanine ligase|nr:UDP-N-acetylmuramate--L-alanine ligase [Propionibacteriaceae bacterium]